MKKRGFTLVEIMIVVAIIGLLAAIAIPSFTKIRAGYRRSACQNGQRLIAHAMEEWASQNNIAEGATLDSTNKTDIAAYLKDDVLPLCPEGNVQIEIPATLGAQVVCPVSTVTADHTIPIRTP